MHRFPGKKAAKRRRTLHVPGALRWPNKSPKIVVKQVFVEDPKEILADGIAALRAGELWHAETFFLEVYQALSRRPQGLNSHEFAYMKAACYGLGRVYRLTERHELAVTALERALPNPVAFKDLIKAFRHLAESAHAQGDQHARAGWYHRMHSLARIHSSVSLLHSPERSQAIDWKLGALWIDQLRLKHGTIYAFRFEGERIAGDTLLTGADYQALRECREFAAATVPRLGETEEITDFFVPAEIDQAPPLEVSALRDLPVDALDVWPDLAEFE
jgi:hypothetical protein